MYNIVSQKTEDRKEKRRTGQERKLESINPFVTSDIW